MVHRVVLPGLAEPRLEAPQVEVQAVLQVQVGLPVPELPPLVRQAQSLERFLLLVLQLQVLEWLAWSALQ